MKLNKLWAIASALLLGSCGGDSSYVPKPHGFPKMVLPEKKYQLMDSASIPYQFELPVYAVLSTDTNETFPKRKGWYNLNFLPFNATLHLTYYQFDNWEFFDSLVYDTRKLVNKHIQRADDILEEPVSGSKNNVKGLVFRIVGNTATNLNFYLTDSVKHFVRGALYFNRQTNRDSVAPVYQYISKDIDHMISTFTWK